MRDLVRGAARILDYQKHIMPMTIRESIRRDSRHVDSGIFNERFWIAVKKMNLFCTFRDSDNL